jgi:hypothetical protein
MGGIGLDRFSGGKKFVSQARFRRPGCGTSPGGQVIDLSVVRQLRRLESSHSVFYLNENQRWLPLLESLPSVNIVDIHDEGALSHRLLRRAPDLFLIESDLKWTDPLITLRQMTQLLSVPFVWICVEQSQRDSDLAKRAYANGATDMLFAPLDRDEVMQTVSVLLRLQLQARL